MSAKSSTARSREYYSRAAATIPPVTIDAETARAFASVRREGESKADCIRRLICKEHESMRKKHSFSQAD